MFSKTIDMDGIKATVHQETGRHLFAKRAMLRKVSVDDIAEWETWYPFFRAVSQSTDVETPFLWPEPSDSFEDLKKARDAWLELPAAVILAWEAALDAVDEPPQPVELTPDATEKNAVSQ